MAKQTFIARLEDDTGCILSFERFGYKHLNTVTKAILGLYKNYYEIYKKDIEKASYLIIYRTPENNRDYIEAIRYTKQELLERIL